MNISLRRKAKRPIDDLIALVDDMQDLRKEVASVVKRAKRDGREGINDFMDNANSLVERVTDNASEFYDGAQDIYKDAAKRGRRTFKTVNRQINDQPIVGVVAAFAVGLLLSRLLSRRD